MRTPSFWQEKSLISTILLPIGWVYSFATSLRIALIQPKKIDIPVICVGNITAGGTGKTPVAISLAKMLKKEGYTPFFISRGYGGILKNIIVDLDKHSAKEVGDEPLLLAREASVAISSDRYQAALLAKKHGANILIMDDGFQNPNLHKDISFVVIDGGFGFGNERAIPSGPLRENLKKGLKRADAIMIIGDDKYNEIDKHSDMKIFKGKISPKTISLEKEKVLAFAGIGRPQKFYTSLQDLGANVVHTIDFPDHHFYTEKELKDILSKSLKINAKPFTTTKDLVKIPKHLQSKFEILEIKIKWEDKESLLELIKNKI